MNAHQPEDPPDGAQAAWDLMRQSGRRFLDICAADLGWNLSRLDIVFKIEGLMQWPDDPKKQEEVFLADRAKWFAENAPSDAYSRDVGIALYEALKLPELDDERDRRVSNGAIIGSVMIDMLGDPNALLSRIIKEHCDWYNRQRPRARSPEGKSTRKKTRIAMSVETNWWPRFRSVAHLWAASVSQKDWTKRAPPFDFPCAAGDLPMFLAVAEYIRCRAERRRLVGQQRPLVGVGEAFAVNPAIKLPFPPIKIGGIPEPWF